MRIVLMRAQTEHDIYVEKLKQLGSVTCIAALDFEFVNSDQLKSNLNSPHKWSGLILTSKRAIESVRNCMQLSAIDKRWQMKPCYVVGEETAKCAEQLGFICCGEKSGNAENLAKLIIGEKKKLQNLPLLFPCGQLKRDILPKLLKDNEILIDPLTTYLTVKHPYIIQNIESYVSKNDMPTHIVFFSPSGHSFCFEIWEKFLGKNLHNTKCVAIGPTTASAFSGNGGVQVLTAKSPTPSSVHDVIISS